MLQRIAIFAVMVGVLPAMAQPGKSVPLSPDLALVPANAFAVTHIKLADLWKSDALKEARLIYAKAGSDAVAAFDKRFVPVLSSIDRLTIYIPGTNLKNGPEDFKFVGILTLTEPLDQTKFLNQFADKLIIKKGKFGNFVTDEDENIAVRFINPKLVVFGSIEGLQEMVDSKEVNKDGIQRLTLDRANNSKDPVVIGISFESLPFEAKTQLTRGIPDLLHPLFALSGLMFSLNLEGDGQLQLSASYPDAKSTGDAEKAIEAGSTMLMEMIADGRKQLMAKVIGDGKSGKIEDLPEAAASLFGLGALQHAEDVIKSKPIKKIDNTLAMTQSLPPQFKSIIGTGVLASSMMAPAIGKVRASASRMKSANNLKQIGLAIHNYHDVNNHFPPAAICDKDGKPLLSWRVAILPYIEQQALYQQFKLNEPWDSEHNIKLSNAVVAVYANPSNKNLKPGHTNYRVFYGNGAMWELKDKIGFAAITDGLSNTWMVFEAEESTPWAKPDDFAFDPKKPLPNFGKYNQGGFNVLFGDGSVRFFAKPPKQAKEMITRNGGEIVNE